MLRARCLRGRGTGRGQIRLDQSRPQNRHNRLPLRLRWISGDGFCRVTFWLPVATPGNHSLSGRTFSLLVLVAAAVPASRTCRSSGPGSPESSLTPAGAPMTVQEAVSRLRVSARRIHDLRAVGELRAFKVSRRLRITPEMLEVSQRYGAVVVHRREPSDSRRPKHYLRPMAQQLLGS